MARGDQAFRRTIEERTMAVSGSTDPLVIVPAKAWRRPIISHLWLTAGGATDLTINSFNGTSDVALSGSFAADTTSPNEWGGRGKAVFVGRELGDSIRLTNSGTASLQGSVVAVYSHV